MQYVYGCLNPTRAKSMITKKRTAAKKAHSPQSSPHVAHTFNVAPKNSANSFGHTSRLVTLIYPYFIGGHSLLQSRSCFALGAVWVASVNQSEGDQHID